jgi:hypothetical protein
MAPQFNSKRLSLRIARIPRPNSPGSNPERQISHRCLSSKRRHATGRENEIRGRSLTDGWQLSKLSSALIAAGLSRCQH